MADTPSSTLSVRARYERLDTDRFTFLDRARQCAELTLPTLIPPLGHTKTTKYYTPWQGIGARGVNTLAAKLLLALLPPNSPFFRLEVDDFTKDKLTGNPNLNSAVEQGFAKIERAIVSEIETTGLRAPIFLAFKHLIVGGNAFVYLPAEGGARVFGLDSFVCRRDAKGNLLEVITKECIDPDSDAKGILEKMEEPSASVGGEAKDEEGKRNEAETTENEDVDVFTRFYLDGSQWKVYQEAFGKVVPGSDGSWPKDKFPGMVLRWNTVDGEAYGRSYIEEYLGDLVSLEGLAKGVVEAAAIAAKVVFLVSPNGNTKAEDLAEAESGDAIVGNKDDVHCVQAEKQADLTIAQKAMEAITQRLSYAFLMTSAIQRNGERVTAEEIRIMAGDLEDALGGVYSLLAQEFQYPLVVRLMDRMTKQKRLPDLPKGIIKPVISTGLEALGRGHDGQRLRQWGATVFQMLGPNAAQFVNINEFLMRLALADGVVPEGLVKGQAELEADKAQAEQAQQQQQMTDIAGKAVGPAINAASDQIKAAGEQQAPTTPNG